jgi:hypothetical protein
MYRISTPFKPSKWTKKELETVKRLLKKGFSSEKIVLSLKGKTLRHLDDLLSQERPFQ